MNSPFRRLFALIRWLLILSVGGYGVYLVYDVLKWAGASESSGDKMHWFIVVPATLCVPGLVVLVAVAIWRRWYRFLSTLLMLGVSAGALTLMSEGVRWLRSQGATYLWMEHPFFGVALLSIAPVLLTVWIYFHGLWCIFRFLDRREGRGSAKTWGSIDQALVSTEAKTPVFDRDSGIDNNGS